ncbi:MAG: DUF3472 domain-containing protein [Fimbriimonas sp.]
MIDLVLLAALSVPAHAAFSEPDPDGIGIEGRAVTTGWKSAKDALVWYGEARAKGEVRFRVLLQEGSAEGLTLTVGKVRRKADAGGDFGSFTVGKGPVRAALSTDRGPGPAVASLEATGDVRWATSKRRNAASVHFRWPTPKGEDIRWFYNEATMVTDPVWSYTMACGFARGYFGMQVNSATERRIIFSVWDAGNEAVDRNKVAAENRVELVAKGEGVVADSFGNEGTGGHSHLVFPWRTGRAVRFLVGCRPEGERTLYAGYFMAPGDKTWRLVAAFRAPKDGQPLRSLYSFSENFWGLNGQVWRESAFGNGWVATGDGAWRPLTEATFTTDGHGRSERWDFDAFVRRGRFHLRHGGFASGRAKYGDTLTIERAGRMPTFDLPALP